MNAEHPKSEIVGDPKRLLLELAGLHQLSDLLPLAVRRLSESQSTALARIWLVRPPLSGDCEACRLASECPQRERCLHLVASAGESIRRPGNLWLRLDGDFRRFPIGVRKVGQIAATGKSLEVADLGLDHAWIANAEWIRDEKIVSFVGHPLMHRGEVLGVLALFSRRQPGDSCFEWLRMIADHLAAAIANARSLEEIEKLKKRLEQENEYLREEVTQSAAFGDLIGQSASLQAVTRQIELVAPTNSAVLILGESGTGKEVVAREIHRHSQRSGRPLIKVNCAAVPRELYESEFFGHAKGAFTGALRDRAGRFEIADGGTFSMKSARFHWTSRRSSCGCCRKARSNASERTVRAGSMCESSLRPIEIFEPKRMPVAFDRTCTIDSACFQWNSRRFASGSKTSRCSPNIF
jgi:hypothetical protein